MDIHPYHFYAKEFAESFAFFLPLERTLFERRAHIRFKKLRESKSLPLVDPKEYMVGCWKLSHVQQQYLACCDRLEDDTRQSEFQTFLAENDHFRLAMSLLDKKKIARRYQQEFTKPMITRRVETRTALCLALAWTARGVCLVDQIRQAVPSDTNKERLLELLKEHSEYFSDEISSLSQQSNYQLVLETLKQNLPYPGKAEYKRYISKQLKYNYLRFMPGVRTPAGNIHADVFTQLLPILSVAYSDVQVKRLCKVSIQD